MSPFGTKALCIGEMSLESIVRSLLASTLI